MRAVLSPRTPHLGHKTTTTAPTPRLSNNDQGGIILGGPVRSPPKKEGQSISTPTETTSTPITNKTTTPNQPAQRDFQTSDNEEWGNYMGEPTQGTLRIGFQNIGPQPASSWMDHAKSTSNYIKQGLHDVFMFAEHCLHFGKVRPEHQWHQRMFSMAVYNVNESESLTSAYQPGGVGLVLTEETMARKLSHGKDPSGLGRWCWASIAGRQGFTTVLVSAYRPTVNKKDIGSTWNQHNRYFNDMAHGRDPIKAFDDDLIKALEEWLASGANIILGMDINEDARDGKLAKRLQELGLREGVTTHHKNKSPPATQNRNTTRTPIDGIWVTGNLEIIKAGYSAFDGACKSDHRALWMDITTTTLLGHRPNDSIPRIPVFGGSTALKFLKHLRTMMYLPRHYP